jgi:hypothetical protein
MNVSLRGLRAFGLADFVAGLRGTEVIADCGDWTPQEQPNAISTAPVEFAGRIG